MAQVSSPFGVLTVGYPPVPDLLQFDPTTSMVGRGSWAPKLDASGSVLGPLPQNPFNLTRPKRERPAVNFKLFNKFSSTIWQISATKPPDPAILGMIWGKKHRIWRNLCQIQLDRIGSWTDREKSCWFSPFFQWFSAGFSFTQNRCSPDGKPTRKTRP